MCARALARAQSINISTQISAGSAVRGRRCESNVHAERTQRTRTHIFCTSAPPTPAFPTHWHKIDSIFEHAADGLPVCPSIRRRNLTRLFTYTSLSGRPCCSRRRPPRSRRCTSSCPPAGGRRSEWRGRRRWRSRPPLDCAGWSGPVRVKGEELRHA